MGEGSGKVPKRKSLGLLDDALRLDRCSRRSAGLRKRPSLLGSENRSGEEGESPRAEGKLDSAGLGNTWASFRKRLKGPRKVKDVVGDVDSPREDSQSKRSWWRLGKNEGKMVVLGSVGSSV